MKDTVHTLNQIIIQVNFCWILFLFNQFTITNKELVVIINSNSSVIDLVIAVLTGFFGIKLNIALAFPRQ